MRNWKKLKKICYSPRAKLYPDNCTGCDGTLNDIRQQRKCHWCETHDEYITHINATDGDRYPTAIPNCCFCYSRGKIPNNLSYFLLLLLQYILLYTIIAFFYLFFFVFLSHGWFFFIVLPSRVYTPRNRGVFVCNKCLPRTYHPEYIYIKSY